MTNGMEFELRPYSLYCLSYMQKDCCIYKKAFLYFVRCSDKIIDSFEKRMLTGLCFRLNGKPWAVVQIVQSYLQQGSNRNEASWTQRIPKGYMSF